MPLRLEFCTCLPINSHPSGMFNGGIIGVSSFFLLPLVSSHPSPHGFFWLAKVHSYTNFPNTVQKGFSSSGYLEKHIIYFIPHFPHLSSLTVEAEAQQLRLSHPT